MTSNSLRWTPLVVLPLLASCNLLTPLVFVGEHKKKILPEFDKLAGKRVAVLVWTDPATLFEYRYARFELATYVADKLHAEMNHRKLATLVIDPRDIEDFIEKKTAARIDPYAVGDQFDVDYVIYIEVLEFQIRDPREPQFLRGRIHASVSVHDMRADPDRRRRFELVPVECVYPDGQPVLISRTNSPLIREALYRKFAEMVARKFYEHSVEL